MNLAPPCRFNPRPISTITRRGLLAGTLALAGIGLAGCRGTAIDEVPAEPVAAFPGLGDPPLLVDVPWFLARRDDPQAGRIVLIDLSDLPTYREGHIPGAVHAWWQDWIDPYSDIYGVLLGTRNVPSARLDLLEKLGIDNDTSVLAYDADRNRYAAHLVWILRYVGLHGASVLDGGLGAWLGTGEERSKEETNAPGATAASLSIESKWTVPFEEMRERFTDPTLAILDVRTDAEAEDTLNGLLHVGQIPGSVRIPWIATLRDDAGRLLSPGDLNTLFAAAGITPDREIVVVARFGVETGQTWLVLSLLGYPNVRVLDRGWAHWGRKDLAMPIAPLDALS